MIADYSNGSTPMNPKRLGIVVLAMALGSAALWGQQPMTAVALPQEANSADGTGNIKLAFGVDAGSSTGNQIGIAANGGTVDMPSINPAPKQFLVIVAVKAGSPSNVSMTLTDEDLGTSVTATARVSPGSDKSTAAESANDPISTATGELVKPSIPADLSLGGPIPLEFRRYYASLINADGINSRMGNNWMHNFEWLLVQNGPAVEVILPGAKPVLFQQFGSGWQLALRERLDYQLIAGPNNTFQFLDPSTNYIYTFSGTATTLGLSKIQDRNGNTLTVNSTTGSAQVSDGLGRVLTITYDANNHISKVADQTGRSVAFAYTGNDLAQFTDASGNSSTFSYTTTPAMNGLMTAETLPLGNKPYTQTWTPLGQVASQSDSFGNATNFSYDPASGSTTIKDPLGISMTHTNRLFSDFTGWTDADGNKLQATLDSVGHRNSVTDRLGNKISMVYDPASGYLSSVTDANGNTTGYTWLAQTSGGFTFYVLAKIQYADGTSTSFIYDTNGNPTAITDQAGKVWKVAYNSRGQRTAVTDPAGRATKYAYNAADGTFASMTDAGGNVTTYSYDPLKRLNLIAFADGTTQSAVYDNLNHVVKEVTENGIATTFAFNANGKLQSDTDGSGKSEVTTYNGNELVSKATDRVGGSTSYTYDALNLNDSVTSPTGEKYSYAFNSHHRLSGAFDPSGNGWKFAYDKEDTLATVTDALSRKTQIATNPFGSITQVTTPLGAKYVIARDQFARATAVTDPTGITTATVFDPRGLEASLTVGNLTSTLSHDNAGLLNGITDPSGHTWSLGIDSGGRVQSRTDPLNRSTTYTFDPRNRWIGAQFPLGSVAATRDADGNLKRLLYSDGTDLKYSFDYLDEVTSGPGLAFQFDAEHRMTGSNGLVIARDANGRLLSITYAPGKTVTYSYNSVGLLGTITDWVGGQTTFTYNAAHELISIKRPNGLGTQFTYNADGFPTSITEDAGSSIVIQTDAAGKTISETRAQPQMPVLAPGTLPLSFDAADQVAGFTYDAMGRLNKDALRTYTWNLASELTAYSGVDGAATAIYDGFGLRTSETSPAGARNFVWNYATDLPSLAIVQDSSGDRRYYVYTPDGLLLYAIDAASNARHYYHFDQNGSTVLLTNDSGTVTDSYGIAPYGETVTHSGSTENPFTWLGQLGVMQEGSNSLYYMRARYYDSATARFLSPDPVPSADPRGMNPYQYALGNPAGNSDPTGLAVNPGLTWLKAEMSYIADEVNREQESILRKALLKELDNDGRSQREGEAPRTGDGSDWEKLAAKQLLKAWEAEQDRSVPKDPNAPPYVSHSYSAFPPLPRHAPRAVVLPRPRTPPTRSAPAVSPDDTRDIWGALSFLGTPDFSPQRIPLETPPVTDHDSLVSVVGDLGGPVDDEP